MVVKEGERHKHVTKQQALIKSLLNKAIQGNPRQLAILIGLMRELSLADDAPECAAPAPELEDAMAFFEKLAKDGNYIIAGDDHE